MGVLNWVQNRMHGSRQSKRKTEFSADSAPSGRGLPQTYQANDCWSTAMLSVGTFGTSGRQKLKSLDGYEESSTVGVNELKKLQEELRLLMTGTTSEELERSHHLPLERFFSCSSHTENGCIAKAKKPLTSAFNGFIPRPSFTETIIWGLLHKTPQENSAFSDHVLRDDGLVQMPQGKAGVHEERGKWIRTDSEYIVLEI